MRVIFLDIDGMHVELAIRVMSWDGKTIPPPMDEMEPKKENEP